MTEKGERRKRRRRTKREVAAPPRGRARAILFWLFVALGTIVAAATTYLLVVFPSQPGPGSGADVEIEFVSGEPRTIVAEKLAKAGLTRSERLFAWYLGLVRPRVAPGRHLLTDDLSVVELVRRVERLGAAERARVTVPEGFTRFDVAKRLHALRVASASVFLEATTDPDLLRELAVDGDSVEGYLFPATYDFPKDSDAREVVRRMKAEFDRRFAALEQNHRPGRAQLESTLGWTRREIVTLASMVEKEAAVEDERPIIASVFLNRLRDPDFKPRLLQCDPTSGYGCLVLGDRVPACAAFAGKITHAINVDPKNAYSTYVREGLPPGPISNPGLPSLKAVLSPASTKYLYFVAREGRRHAFSETIEDHNAAVKDLRERKATGAAP